LVGFCDLQVQQWVETRNPLPTAAVYAFNIETEGEVLAAGGVTLLRHQWLKLLD